jgi:LPXTG-motif cell wall-anchored protein
MIGRIKLAGLVAAFLVMLFPFLTLAEDVNFSVVPAEVHIDSLLPGEATEFELTIHNKDDIANNFTFTTFPPPEEQRREGRAQFPDDSWISFSYPRIEIAANSQANVTVTTAIPREQKWAGRGWEIWLAVTAESSDMLAVKLYVRLLVSTGGTRVNAGLVAGIAAAAVLLGCGAYFYFRRKTRPE